MSTVTYHRATGDDIQTLINSRVEFLSEIWGKQSEETETILRKELKSFFEDSIPNESYIFWIATIENRFAGIGGMFLQQRPGSFRVPNGKLAYIMNMYTAPEHRKKGIAKTILNKLVEAGKEKGIHCFELHSTKAGEPVYQQGGFAILSEPRYRKYVEY